MNLEAIEAKITDQFYDFNKSAEQAAAERNCYVVLPKDNQLLIDIDSDEEYKEFQIRFGDIDGNPRMFPYRLIVDKDQPSRSGLPCRHIYVSIYERDDITQKLTPVRLTDWQRIAMQFMLGSDRVREIMSVYRMLAGTEDATRFFEPLEGAE